MLLRAVRKHNPDGGPVLVEVSTGRALSYSDLCARTGQTLAYLKAAGVGPGQSVALCLNNSLESAALMIALFEADVAVVLLNTMLHGRELGELAAHCGAKLFITAEDGGASAKGALTASPEEIFRTADFVAYDPDSAAPKSREAAKYIFFSSGTTGSPKGIVLSRGFVHDKLRVFEEVFAFEAKSRYLSFIPFFVSLGLVPSFLAPLYLGCKVYVDHFSPFIIPHFWDTVKGEKINYFASVPGLWRMLRNNAADPRRDELGHVRRVFCSSAPMPPDIFEWLAALGIRICNCLGMSETASYFCVSTPESSGPQCVGAPAGCEVGILDESGRVLETGQSGEICVRPPQCLSNYYRAPKITEQAMRFGWFHTGDIGRKDERGNVYIVDRKKHIVIKNGFNIFPAEVDAVMNRHPLVRECASFGVPDEEYGERLVSAVVADSDCGADALRGFAAENMPRLMVPDEFFFVSDIPRAANGKTKIRVLRGSFLGKQDA